MWLNLPAPPLEASGTSGMKVVANGGLNCSILDGWWIEGYERRERLGHRRAVRDAGEGPAGDRGSQRGRRRSRCYEIIENQIRPLFYERNRDGVPRGWVARMRASMKTLAPAFSATRMVKDYARIYYK